MAGKRSMARTTNGRTPVAFEGEGALAAGDPSEPSDQTVGLIYKFLESVVLDDRGLRGKVGVLSVRGRSATNVPTEPVMPDIAIDPSGGEEHFLAIATRIATESANEAQGLGQGTWPFVIIAKRDGENSPFARRSFTVFIEHAPGGDVGPADDGSMKGQLAQSLRHIEAQMRINVQAMSFMMGQSNALVQTLMQQNREYQDTHADALQLYRLGIDNREGREVDREERQLAAQRMDKALSAFAEHIMPILGAGIATWMAKNGFLPGEGDDQPKVEGSA